MKIGDKVLCLDASESRGVLMTGAIYTVSGELRGCVSLEEVPGYSWTTERFKKMEQVNETPDPPHRREDTQKG